MSGLAKTLRDFANEAEEYIMRTPTSQLGPAGKILKRQACMEKHEDFWELIPLEIWINTGKYGSYPDVEEIAYLLRMGGIEADHERPE